MARLWRRGSSSATDPPAELERTVLVVDDDDFVRGLLSGSLAQAGFRVVEAADGAAALEVAASERPDLVLLDWMMPGMLGVDVCRAITSAPGTSSVPVVMLTTLGDESEVTEAFQSGAVEYLTKPFDVREVVSLVRRVLGASP